MRFVLAVGLLVTLTAVACQEAQSKAESVPRPLGVIYLIQVLNRPQIQREDSEISNTIPNVDPYKTNKLLLALSPSDLSRIKGNREKRSPTYKGGGGGGCNVCGGGGGGHQGGGGYPSGGGFGGGGGGGYGSSGSWSQASASSGSYGSGGGYGKGYGK